MNTAKYKNKNKNKSKSFPYPDNKHYIYIYGKKDCPYCIAAEQLMKENNFDYKYYKIEDLIKNGFVKDNIDFINKINKFIGKQYKTVPMIFINMKFIGGYDKFLELLEKSKK
jgi:glutaredoxin